MNKQIHFFSYKIKYLIKNKRKLIEWLERVITENGKITGEINLIITSDKVLQEINIKYLYTDKYTDTISFILSEEEEIVSGDVYISIERVIENAGKYKVSQEEELNRILVHSVLHLMGYDDKTRKERLTMRKLENKYLDMVMQ